MEQLIADFTSLSQRRHCSENRNDLLARPLAKQDQAT